MIRSRRRLVAPAVACAVLTLASAACSDDDDGTDGTTSDEAVATTAGERSAETAADEATVATFEERDYVTQAADALDLGDAATSECLAQALVDAIGMDRIEDRGVSPEELTGSGSL